MHRKRVGDAWEVFCREYLRARGFDRVLLLAEAPEEALAALSLGRRDVGIDLVAFREGRAHSVQCKFRARGCVSWRELATFEALCARTGPWETKIVMTNATGIRREGTRDARDRTIARQTFDGMRRHDWDLFVGWGAGYTLESPRSPQSDRARPERTRSARGLARAHRTSRAFKGGSRNSSFRGSKLP